MIETSSSNGYTSDKLKSIDETTEIINKLRENQRRLRKCVGEVRNKEMLVGLCIGGYDLLHPGHMTHIRSAKGLCDLLVVGVTTDRFNKDRKGKGRPIYNENLRAFTLTQLEKVDLVFLSDYDMAVQPILRIKPDLYIKGPDYLTLGDNKTEAARRLAEREATASVGGKVIFTADEKLSTSTIIKYIQSMV